MEHPEHREHYPEYRDNFKERKSIVRYFLLCELSLFYPLLLSSRKNRMSYLINHIVALSNIDIHSCFKNTEKT